MAECNDKLGHLQVQQKRLVTTKPDRKTPSYKLSFHVIFPRTRHQIELSSQHSNAGTTREVIP